MTEEELRQRLDAQDAQLVAIHASVEKTRRYFLWTLVGSIVVFIVPLVILIIAIPWMLSTLTSTIFDSVTVDSTATSIDAINTLLRQVQ